MGILDGKAAVVTGGGRGIGRGHCLHLAREGAAVVVNDVDAEEARAVAEEIAKEGGRACADGSDVGTRAGARALVARCVEEFGAIDAIVNNAGNVRDRSFLKMSDDEFGAVMRVHVHGTFMCAQEAALRMRERGAGGSILNTTSAAHFGNFGQTNYAGAKGAIASMTYTWAVELLRFGIRVNAISPSGTTRMSQQAKLPGGGATAEGWFLDPTLNGPFVAWLCSDDASWVTGQIFGVGGQRVAIVEQPRYGTTMFHADGWSVEALRRQMKPFFGGRLEPFGLAKTPYAHYGGVKPQAE